MDTTPSQLQNFFLIATENSYTRFETVSNYHKDALNASEDAVVKQRYTFYLPFWQTFQDKYIDLNASGEQKQGDTQVVKQLLKDLGSNLIDTWDVKIQSFYSKKTSKYKGLLPNGRKPFQQGKQKERIDALATLIQNIGPDTNLAPLKDEISEFYTSVKNAQGTKVGKVADLKVLSDDVEAARVAAAQAMFKNYGELISYFYLSPELAAPYFDWATLYPKAQQTFELNIKAGVTKNVVKKTMTNKQTITAENQGTTVIELFSTNKKTGATSTAKVTLQPGDIKTVTPAQIGNTKDTPFINIRNTDTNSEARAKVQIS